MPGVPAAFVAVAAAVCVLTTYTLPSPATVAAYRTLPLPPPDPSAPAGAGGKPTVTLRSELGSFADPGGRPLAASSAATIRAASATARYMREASARTRSPWE